MSATKQQFTELCDKSCVTKREALHDLREYLPLLGQTSTYFKTMLDDMK